MPRRRAGACAAPPSSCIGKCRGAVVRERRLGLFMFRSAAPPRIGCRAYARPRARSFFEALGMGDAAPGDHPVHFAGADRLLGADAVAMHDLAVEEIGDGRRGRLRMRPDVHAARYARRRFASDRNDRRRRKALPSAGANGSTRPTWNPPRSRRRESMTSMPGGLPDRPGQGQEGSGTVFRGTGTGACICCARVVIYRKVK